MSKQEGKDRETSGVELMPDAWDRFTKFIRRAAEVGPKHRAKEDEKVVSRREQETKR